MFNLTAEVEARTGRSFGPQLPQQEIILLLSEVHAYHAGRIGWATDNLTHGQVTGIVGNALDRALEYAAELEPATVHKIVVAPRPLTWQEAVEALDAA